jgi:DNA end-binding protein Ku
MVDERTGKVVDKDDKGRGYELSKGKYVEVEPEELDAVEVEATHIIDIDTLVPAEEIDRRYFDKPYYIAPDGKTGADAFKASATPWRRHNAWHWRASSWRIGSTSSRWSRSGRAFLGTTLRYDYEVRDAKPYLGKVPSPRVDKEMVDIAKISSSARPAISIRRSSRTSTRRHSRSW